MFRALTIFVQWNAAYKLSSCFFVMHFDLASSYFTMIWSRCFSISRHARIAGIGPAGYMINSHAQLPAVALSDQIQKAYHAFWISKLLKIRHGSRVLLNSSPISTTICFNVVTLLEGDLWSSSFLEVDVKDLIILLLVILIDSPRTNIHRWT